MLDLLHFIRKGLVVAQKKRIIPKFPTVRF